MNTRPEAERRLETLRSQLDDLQFAVSRLEDAGLADAAELAPVQEETRAATAQAESVLESGAWIRSAGARLQEAELRIYKALRSAAEPEKSSFRKGAPLAIGIDLGGTKILAAAVDKKGVILARTKVKTGAGDSVDTIVERLSEAVTETLAAVGAEPKQMKGVGIGAPGSINYDKGEVVLAPNLAWRDVPLKRLLEEKLPDDCPVHLENDVNIGTLAESKFGIGRGLDHVASMFWGTGIGGGVVCNGELLHGGDGMAAEIGHVIVNPGGPECGCGNHGCLEASASRTGISRQIRLAVAKGKRTVWSSRTAEDLELIRSGKLAKAYRSGDKVTTKIVNRAAKEVGIVAASVANVLASELVIIGGGVMESMAVELLPVIRKAFRKHLFSARSRHIPVVPSQLADDAGILGGAALVWLAA